MNTKIYHSLYALFVAGALLASGCSNDDTYDFYATPPDAVRFHITAGDVPQTRLNSEGDGTTFDPDDQIAISADGGTSYSTYVQSSGDDWLPAEGQRYLCWKEQTLSFQAYYPVTVSANYTHFTVPNDQSNQTKLRKADYMTAETADQSSANPVALTFKHRLAKVTAFVTLGEELKGKEIQAVSFRTFGRRLENGNITDSHTPAFYSSFQEGNSYTVILPPQSENNSAAFIKVLLDNSEECTLTGIPALDSGKAYTLLLQVGHDGVKLAAPITVAEWRIGLDMTGGTAMFRPEYYLWYAANPDASEFTLSTADELRAFAKLVNGDQEALTATTATGPVSFEGKTVQIADTVTMLDLSGTQWTPIGNRSVVPFKGIFDGKGKEIKGLTITASSGDDFGLFGYMNGDAALVKNVRLTGVNIECPNSSYIGGIVGILGRGSVSSCYVSGTIAGDRHIGGIAGAALGSSNNFITDCYTAGSITGGSTFPCLIGGIVGYALVPVENCYSTANVTTAGSEAGGITGINTGAIISHCYSTGTVSGDTEIGGITGTCGAGSKTTGCIALNAEVKAWGRHTSFGRISGGITEYADPTIVKGILEDCYAFSGMKVYKGSELQAINDGAANNINGADLDATTCLTAATYTDASPAGAGWSTDHWAFDSNTPMQSLPWLKVFDSWTWEDVADYRLAVPAHLVPVP